MLETLLLCDFFFDGDPEFILLMMYILFSLLGNFLRSTPFQPVFAPHLVDKIVQTRAVEAAIDAHQRGASIAAVEAAKVASRPLLRKYCGDTLGETAATCGLVVAWKAYHESTWEAMTRIQHHSRGSSSSSSSSRRYHNHRPHHFHRNKMTFRRLYFEILGRWVNFVDDAQTWMKTVDFKTLAVSTAARTETAFRKRWKLFQTVDWSAVAVSTAARGEALLFKGWEVFREGLDVLVSHWKTWRRQTREQPDWKRAAATTVEYGWALARTAFLSAARTADMVLHGVVDQEPAERNRRSSPRNNNHYEF